MRIRLCTLFFAVIALTLWGYGMFVSASETPNIVFILADDIGYGDLGCYGATKIQTPHCDKLAAGGLRFTDAHATAALCTPSRYSLLTGEYYWRKLGPGFIPGAVDLPAEPSSLAASLDRFGVGTGETGLLIEPGRTTVASLLKRAGYTTGVVGKWHLGLGTTPTNFNSEITPGPLDIGFDYAWLMPVGGDRVPCVWIENRRVVNLDPADPIRVDYSVPMGRPATIVKGIARIGAQWGGKAALWDDAEIADVIVAKSVAFIEQNAKTDKPFFLYLPTHDIHVPRVPHERFHGKSQAGIRGDSVASFDWTVGQIVASLEKLKLTDNTLIVITSDNGGALDGGTPESNAGHLFNGALRGAKASPFEGGTRIPFIAKWSRRIPVGVSDALICQVDMLATFAALTGQPLAENDAPDSENILPAFLEKRPGREVLVQSGQAIRMGLWKMIPPVGRAPINQQSANRNNFTDEPWLFHLGNDLGEQHNIATSHPEIVKKKTEELQRIRNAPRTHP